jgi:histone-lysine N-methyltransferase SETMAR
LSQIVTGDETWVSHSSPESKQQSIEWRHTEKAQIKQTISTRKIKCTVFFWEFLPQGTTINSTAYCETMKKLRCAIQNKRRGMRTHGLVLLHDNVRPHTTAQTQALVTSFGWEQFNHPHYSPDLAPSDFHLFLCLKKFLAGQHFLNNDVKEAVKKLPSSQEATFYKKGIHKLVPRYDKCLMIVKTM